MIITPFIIEDYAEIELANGIGLHHWGFRNGVLPVLINMERSKTFWTLRDEKGILVIGGYFQAFEGVCEASLLPSVRFVNNPRATYRLLKQRIQDWTSRFRRVQLNCRAEEKFIRFAKALGFEVEGTIRKFDFEGRDHVILAIVR